MLSFGQNLEAKRAEAIAAVNAAASQARGRYFTDILAQDTIYAKKEAEAKDYLAADPEPTALNDYPFLSKEVGKVAPTAYEVAQVYVNMAAQWEWLAAEMEDIRIGSLLSIEQATSVADILAARQSGEAALAAL